jgi:hypothetical protein
MADIAANSHLPKEQRLAAQAEYLDWKKKANTSLGL